MKWKIISPKKRLLIIGARGWGREVYNIALKSHGYDKEFTVKGFLDDKKDALSGFRDYPPIIDSVENYQIQANDVFICALGDVHQKLKYAALIAEKGGRFISLIHKEAICGHNLKIGTGCIIAPAARIGCDVTIGNFVTVQSLALIGHDSVIGDGSMIDTYCFTGGAVTLGENTTMHTGSKVLPRLSIGSESTIGAGSIVIKDAPAGVTLFGNPAKIIFY